MFKMDKPRCVILSWEPNQLICFACSGTKSQQGFALGDNQLSMCAPASVFTSREQRDFLQINKPPKLKCVMNTN